jgi:hypothetical protein
MIGRAWPSSPANSWARTRSRHSSARLFDVTVSTLFHAAPFFTYAITRDGQRFLVSRAKDGASTAYEVPLTVVLNWNAAVGR